MSSSSSSSSSSSIVIQLQSLVATTMYNFESSRFQKASLDTRQEGWTETWGSRRDDDNRGSGSGGDDEVPPSTTSTGSTDNDNVDDDNNKNKFRRWDFEQRHKNDYVIMDQQRLPSSAIPLFRELLLLPSLGLKTPLPHHHPSSQPPRPSPSSASLSSSSSLPPSPPPPPPQMVLTQFRPAWLEQIVLGILKVPHVVVNSTYVCTEATGPLPFLKDYLVTTASAVGDDGVPIPSSSSSPASSSRLPKQDQAPRTLPKSILVGRRHPSNIVSHLPISDNDILVYLQSQYRQQVNDCFDLSDDDDDAAAAVSAATTTTTTTTTRDHARLHGLHHCFMTMIQSELTMCLEYLRYEDGDVWNQIYKYQYLQAAAAAAAASSSSSSSTGTSKSWSFFRGGRFQASMDRAVGRRRLLEYKRRHVLDGDGGGGGGVSQVIHRAKKCYEALERQLTAVAMTVSAEEDEESSGDATKTDRRRSYKYLLKTDKPCWVDAYLFAHLMDALSDVHLVLVLATFPRLVQYVQGMYREFFDNAISLETDWGKWNQIQNQTNAFQQIPMVGFNKSQKAVAAAPFKDAVELMQSMSLRNHKLQIVLDATKAKRDAEPWPVPRNNPTDSLFYRWRMGEDVEATPKNGGGATTGKATKRSSSNNNGGKESENPIRKKFFRDQIRNDQLWISGVAGVSIVAILLLQGGGPTTSSSSG